MAVSPSPLIATLLVASFSYSFANPSQAADLRNGRDIHEVCATCHGEFSEGGKEGEYPRLAGQPAAFIANQLLLFRTRKRENIPMVQHTEQRELPDEDIEDISAYIEQIELATRLDALDESTFNAYARLQAAKRIFNVARAEGDAARGESIYNKECRSCHGDDGWGRHDKAVPMIAGQYTNYLWRQVDKLLSGARIHDPDSPDEELLKDFSHDEIRDIFAFLATVDD